MQLCLLGWLLQFLHSVDQSLENLLADTETNIFSQAQSGEDGQKNFVPHQVDCFPFPVVDQERELVDVALPMIDGVGHPRRWMGSLCRSGLARPHPVSLEGNYGPIVPLRSRRSWLKVAVINVMMLVSPIA